MKPVFADTSYYLALLSREDAYHETAVRWSEELLGRIVVTEYVLLELGNALSRSRYRNQYVPFVNSVLSDRGTLYIAAAPKLFRDGLRLYVARNDHEWSMVDCISFVVMKQRRLSDALTADRHFIQAGYRALLREAVR